MEVEEAMRQGDKSPSLQKRSSKEGEHHGLRIQVKALGLERKEGTPFRGMGQRAVRRPGHTAASVCRSEKLSRMFLILFKNTCFI